jgi:predicted DNA-binding transcriptional regulator YafY
VEQWLSGAFQLIGCGEAARHTVRLQFSPPAARYICERQWHISQTLDELPDGQVILTLQLASFVELERWILTWGEHVEVLEPASLRTRVARTSRMIAAKYRVSRATPQPRCLHNEPTTERVG